MLRKRRKGLDPVLQGVQPEMSIKIQFWDQNLLLNKVVNYNFMGLGPTK